MSDLGQLFKDYGAGISRDQRLEKLLRALEPFLFDGSEIHHVIDQLRGPENEIVASAIRHAALAQYHDCAPIDIILEVVGRLLDEGKLS